MSEHGRINRQQLKGGVCVSCKSIYVRLLKGTTAHAQTQTIMRAHTHTHTHTHTHNTHTHTGFGAPPPVANPEQAYASQLEQLSNMGFIDTAGGCECVWWGGGGGGLPTCA